MKKTFISILLGATLFISLGAQAQTHADIHDSKKALKEAKRHIAIDEYPEALPFLQKAYAADHTNSEAAFLLGKVYVILHLPAKALAPLETAHHAKYADPDGNFKYYYAEALHANNKFDEAIKYYREIEAVIKPTDELYAEVDRSIQMCNNGKELIKKPIKVKIKNLGKKINTEWPEYGPVISADETLLLYTARKPNTTGGGKDPDDEHFYEDVYMSSKTDSGWSAGADMGIPVNTNSHDAVVGLSADGEKLLIYKSVKGQSELGDLFLSELHGDKWSEPKGLGPNVNTEHSEQSGSITSDEKMIFFSSDRPGGMGGLDIYVSLMQPNGVFGPAVNLGPSVNSIYNDDAPFIHPDGQTLYYSSLGHNSMGGYDIFHSTINPVTGGVIGATVNVGYPINTADNDIFFVWSTDGKRAYFASVRDGGYGDKDLYMLEKEEEEKPHVAMFKGFIYGKDTRKPVEAKIDLTDNVAQKSLGIYHSNSASGKYTVMLPAGKDYGVAVEAEGYLFYSKNIDIPKSFTYGEITDTIFLEPIKIGSTIVLRNVFFDVDKATLRPESKTELDRLLQILKENPKIRIRLGGHTDSDSDDAHNNTLSDNRAKAVVEYLVEAGIQPTRLEHAGYGESRPVVPNDTPEHKQMNRRTEFEIIQ